LRGASGSRECAPDDRLRDEAIQLLPWIASRSLSSGRAVVNDDPAWVLPMPARYVVGTDGIIAYAEVNPDYTQRPDPGELLPVLDRLKTSKAA
jgi:hypothetical protein